jgi:hypothetical protein
MVCRFEIGKMSELIFFRANGPTGNGQTFGDSLLLVLGELIRIFCIFIQGDKHGQTD